MKLNNSTVQYMFVKQWRRCDDMFIVSIAFENTHACFDWTSVSLIINIKEVLQMISILKTHMLLEL